MKTGTSTFAGLGNPRVIPHGLKVIPSAVIIMPSANGGGYIGEYYYVADETNISVYNSGSATTGFTWVAFK